MSELQRRRRSPGGARGVLALVALAAACSTPVVEPAPPTPTMVVGSTAALSPSPAPADEPSSSPTATPSSRVEHPRAERCEGLLEVVEQVHEDPHNVVLPEPYELVYETEPVPGQEDWLGAQEGRTIQVWPRLHEDDDALVFSILHEIGHLYDSSCLGIEGRQAWMEARGTGTHLVEWASGDDWTRPNEDYADAWAVCQGGDADQWRTVAGEPPTQEECSLAVPVE